MPSGAGKDAIAASVFTPPPSPDKSNNDDDEKSTRINGGDSPNSISSAIVPPPRSSSSPQIQNRSSIISACASWITGTTSCPYSHLSFKQIQQQKSKGQHNELQQSATPQRSQSPADPPPNSPIAYRRHPNAPAGYLWKQGSSLKLWKRRYFVLQDNNCVFYFTSREDAERPDATPIGVISLNNFRGVWRCDDNQMASRGRFVFRIECSERKWLIASEDNDTVEEWISALRQILQDNRAFMAGTVSDRVEHAPALMKGWLEKHSRGSVRYRWFELKYNMLYCYRDDSKKDLLRMISLKSCLLEIPRSQQVRVGEDSDAEEGLLPEFIEYQHITERPAPAKHQQPQYGRLGLHLASEVIWLKCFDLEEHEKWACVLLEIMDLHPSCETPTEHAISDILQTFPPHLGWNETWMTELNLMIESRRSLHFEPGHYQEPQTTIIGQRQRKESIKLSKGIHMFMEANFDRRSNPNYLAVLAQSLVRRCLRDKQLQNEIIAQLIRLTTLHPEPDSFAHLRAWQLLGVCLTIFLPTRKVFAYLQLHLKKSRIDFRGTLIQSYISYCEGVLLSVQNESPIRRQGPSKMEMNFLLSLHNSPKEMNIPVHCVNGCIVSVTFAPHTRIDQIQEIMMNTLGMQSSQITNPSMFTICAYLVKPAEDNNSYTVHNIPLDSDFCIADLVHKHEKQREEFELAGMQFPSFLGLQVDYLFLEFRLRHLIPLSPFGSSSGSGNPIGGAFTSNGGIGPESEASLNAAERKDSRKALVELKKPFTLAQVNVFKGNIGETKSISLQRWRLINQHATQIEKDFIFRQMNDLIVRGKYPLTFEAAIRLAALQAQATWGDHFPLLRTEDQQHLDECVKTFLPAEFRKMTAAQLSSTAVAQQSSLPIASQSAVDGIKSTVATVTIQNLKRNKLAALLKRLAGVLFFCCKPSPPAKSSEAHPIAIAMTALSTAELKAKAVASKISQFWIQLRGFSAEQCIDIYLENAFLWPWAMWSSMFPAKVECPEMSSRLKKQQKFLFAACTDAVGILNFETKQSICVFGYNQIISGGISDKHSIFLILEASDEDDLIFNGKRSGAVKMEISIPTIKATDLMDWLNYFIDLKASE